MADILVTGATGGIGRQVVQQLHESGAPVVALCRRADQVEDHERRGIRAALGDLRQPESLGAAMTQAKTLFLLTRADRQQAAYGSNAVRAAERAGIERVVHLSTADANPASPVPWAAAPARTDALLRVSDLRWTSLKPAGFMQNLLDLAPAIRRGVLPQTTGKGAVGWIDVADIADSAVRVLLDDVHDGRELILTGPELLSMADLAQTLQEVLERRVRFLDLPAPVFRLLLRVSGTDAWQADGLSRQFSGVVRHGQDGSTELTPTVRELTGHPPRCFRDFAVRHQSDFLTQK